MEVDPTIRMTAVVTAALPLRESMERLELLQASKSLLTSRQVLVVDDDDGVRDVLATVLEIAGYEVAVASDGLEALDQLEDHKPALILLDLMMPGMDGFTFADELQRRGLRPAVPIIVMSAGGLAQQGARTIAAEDCVIKPLNLDDLLQKVDRLGA